MNAFRFQDKNPVFRNLLNSDTLPFRLHELTIEGPEIKNIHPAAFKVSYKKMKVQ